MALNTSWGSWHSVQGSQNGPRHLMPQKLARHCPFGPRGPEERFHGLNYLFLDDTLGLFNEMLVVTAFKVFSVSSLYTVCKQIFN